MTIDSNAVIARTRDHVETELDDETIVMHTRSGHIFGMSDTAQAVWRQLAVPRAFEAIVAGVADDYAIGADACREDVRAFLAELAANDMIVVASAADAYSAGRHP